MDIFTPNWEKIPDGSGRVRELFMKEIRKGHLLEDMQADDRERDTAQRFSALRDLWKSQKSNFGAPLLSIPAKEFYREVQEHGDGIWHEKDFQNWYLRKNPHLGDRFA